MLNHLAPASRPIRGLVAILSLSLLPAVHLCAAAPPPHNPALVTAHDTYDGQPIVVTFDPAAGTTAVFVRIVEGQTLTFSMTGRLVEGEIELQDLQTGSTWSGATGRARSGPLLGAQPEQIPTFLSFWFAWSDFFPDTELYSADETAG